MPPVVLLVVKLSFLVLLYLFVARAVRAVVLDVFGPRKPRRRARAARPGVRPAAARPPRRQPRELVVQDAGGKRTVRLSDSVTIGRAATCDLVLADTYVSNVHARVFARDGGYFVEDLGSTNGTYVNRTKVTMPMPLGPGDQVRVGKASLELRR